jgi:hypothetical protein
VAGEEKIEEHNGRYDTNQQHGKREVVIKLQIAIDRDSEDAPEAIIDGPDGEKKVSGFTLIGIAAAGAAIEGGEVVAQSADTQDR